MAEPDPTLTPRMCTSRVRAKRPKRAANVTPLRLAVMRALAAEGTMSGQEIGMRFATSRRADAQPGAPPFRAPCAGARWAAAMMSPMVGAGLVHRLGTDMGGFYSIKQAGIVMLSKAAKS